jgi:molybdopterin/thiamine biosynthesis adenylyltransferase
VNTIQLTEGRFARLEAIEWWDQALLARTRVLVIGAGALGNEVIKNLALLGMGHLAIADMDRIELSNLSRSVLFRATDEGRLKADCAARSAREIYGGMNVKAFNGNVLAELGLGHFRWADVVIGALDNREARVFVNSACARVGRPWFDGGIEVLHGVVRGFAAPQTACYECTMSKVDWDLLNKRRSCSLLARRAIEQRGTPTTPTTASVIAGIQVAEVIKHLHGLGALLGKGFVFDGAEHTSYRVNYPVDPDCPWHDPAPRIEVLPQLGSRSPLSAVWREAESRLGGVDALDFARELVNRVVCPSCRWSNFVGKPAETVHVNELLCSNCRTECTPEFIHSIAAGSELLAKSVHEIGLPRWEIVWARRGMDCLGLELAGDNPWSTNGNAPQPN